MNAALAIVGGSVLTPQGWVEPATVVVRDGVIVDVAEATGTDALPGDAVRVDASGRMVVPGFVDLQCNGAVGVDLGSNPEQMWEVAAVLPRWGVTAWLPTITTGPPEIRHRAQAAWADRPDGFVGAEPLGVHFEGPFLAPDRLGAHRAEYRREPDLALVDGWTAGAGAAMVTMAPERPGGFEVVRRLRDAGVVVAAGHSSATYAEAQGAFDAGVGAVTHLFNAMAPFHHREPGLIGAALADHRVAVGLIADGHHVHPGAVRTAAAALGDRLVLVTDAVAALGVDRSQVSETLPGLVVDDETVRLADGTLAGSLLTMVRAVANAASFGGLSLGDAIRAASETPSRVLGDEDRGLLEPGRRGDLVILDGASVVATVVAGRLVYERESGARSTP